MNIIYVLLFSIFNRFRGADGFTIIGKLGTMFLLFFLLWPIWWKGLVISAFYLLGQSIGWGWWIGYILNGKISSKKVDGFREKILSNISKSIFPNNYLYYSYLSLSIVGLLWWLPIILFFNISWITILSIIFCSIGFPLSFEIAKKIPDIKFKLINDNWEVGELIYGLLIGLGVIIL